MNRKQSNPVRLLKFALIIPVLVGIALVINAKGHLAQVKGLTVQSPPKGNPVEGSVILTTVTHDFGTVKESGGKVSTSFSLMNNVKEPLLISNVTTTCGCTVAEWTKEPIAKGKSGYIKATFDPKGRVGAFTRKISVICERKSENTTYIFEIKGTVVP